MSPLVITESREALETRRREITALLGLDAKELSELEGTKTLTADEQEALEELQEIAFLLGE